MEIDENNQSQQIQSIDLPAAEIIQQNAPIVEPEILSLSEEIGNNEEAIQLEPSPSSFLTVHTESVITAQNGNKQKLGMIRLRRKRRLDPFGNLILSTKKMKLNDAGGNGQEEQNEGNQCQKRQQSVEFGEDDGLVFYYGGEDDEDDSADGYDDEDADSNAENYYKNDYPNEDEGGGNEFENESTSDDDYFDHYGDENIKYRNYCYDKEISDQDEDDYD